MQLIYHDLSLPNDTTSLENKGQFEGFLLGVLEPEFLSKASGYSGWSYAGKKKKKRQVLQRIPTVTAKSI